MKLLKLSFIVFSTLALLAFNAPVTLYSQISDTSGQTVKIGLLIQDNSSLAARYGAEMAISKANKEGGFNGKKFQLVIRSMEGPWGTGSKQAVDLIFGENVWALMGSHDGRNAHLVEQVTTKTRIVFLSAWASDPTLAQAFVPWYFSCVPNNLQQADALINEIYNIRKLKIIASVSDNSYDSKLAAESFLKKIRIAGKKEPIGFVYDNPVQDFNDILSKINKSGVDGIILFGNPPASIKFIEKMEKKKMKQTVYGAISVLNEDESSMQEQEDFRNMTLFVSGNWSSHKGMAFRKEYQRLYGTLPGAVAAYSYDGMCMLVEAIRRAGLNREEIQKSLMKIHFDGITGLIQFDDKGKRKGAVRLMELKNGIPVSDEK